jgi:hypothetical protein
MSVTVACAVAACGDDRWNPTDPSLTMTSDATASASETETVGLLKRTEDLPGALSATGVIGPNGGQLRIHKAGIRVDFPRGAVDTETRITVTAVPGRVVAYRFEPHGLVFAQPVTVTQSLRGTAAWRNPSLAAELQGSYFERLFVDTSHSFAKSSERRPGKLKEFGRALEFTIEHFSGYMVSTGKASIDVDISTEVHIR